MNAAASQSAHNLIDDVSIDCVMIGFHADELKVLLLKQGEREWGLPRGRIYRQEQIAAAGSRVLREATGIENVFLQQFHTFSAGRYQHQKRPNIEAEFSVQCAISIGFYALVDFEKVTPNS